MTVMSKPETGLSLGVPALLTAIRPLLNVVEKRNTIPVLDCVLVRAHGDRVTVTGSDMDLQVTETLHAEAPDGQAFCVDAHRFARLLHALDDAVIDLGVSDNRLLFAAGDTAGHFGTIPVEDFPIDHAPFDEVVRFEIEAGALRTILADTRGSVSDEETRYYLNGVYLHVTATPLGGGTLNVLRGVATNGHQLTMSDAPAPADATGMRGVIVPKKTVDFLLRRLGGHGDQTVRVEVADRHCRIRFTMGDTVVLSKLIDGTFPDYMRVVPTQFSRSAQVNRKALLSAIRRVTALNTDRRFPAIKFFIDGTKLQLQVTSPEGGEARTAIAAASKGGPVEWGLNANYLRQLLSVSEADTITLHMTDHMSPIVLQGDDEARLRQVIMPMRV